MRPAIHKMHLLVSAYDVKYDDLEHLNSIFVLLFELHVTRRSYRLIQVLGG